MPFIPHTPESLLPRSDSKNPAATCSGLTASGRPCRRAVAHVLPTLRQEGARLFCWQHQDQAQHTSQTLPQGLQTLRERTSTDTLIDRLGLLSVNSGRERQRKWREGHREKPSQHTQKSRPSPESKSTFLCCFGVVEEQPLTPRPVSKQHAKSATSRPRRSAVPETGQAGARVASSRPTIPRDPSSNTMALLSLIPKNISPQTASSLVRELAKPASESDEAGFIYMFWLTPASLPSKPSEAALDILEQPEERSHTGRRRTSDVLRSFSDSSAKTILLKIGRASNVQRRLNEWNRQCGYNLSLVRYYPYSPTPISGPAPAPRKVSHAHKVERLIHLELAGKKAQSNGPCSQCGREHREWFEIEAHKAGVRSVDEVIRRWVDWSLSL